MLLAHLAPEHLQRPGRGSKHPQRPRGEDSELLVDRNNEKRKKVVFPKPHVSIGRR